MIPTINQVINEYKQIAKAEFVKCGRPGPATVRNAVRGTTAVCKAAGIPLGAHVNRLTRKAIDQALMTFLDQQISRVSAWTYAYQLRALFAKWTRPYYEDCGWEIPPIELPTFRAQPPRYARPNADLLRNLKAWYEQLDREAFAPRSPTSQSPAPSPIGSRRYLNDHEKEREWLAVTLMLEFAVRNGDILRLTPANFIEKPAPVTPGNPQAPREILHYLSYTPHKTELSSGRRVCWPIHAAIWARLGPLVSDGDKPDSALIRTLDTGVFERLNRHMRSLGFKGEKGAYELRKICIDHIYQQFGAEQATAISGDDIKTITHYYADPSAVTVVGVRILDLL